MGMGDCPEVRSPAWHWELFPLLDGFEKSSSDVIQLVTWNDFQEGTVIEPTVQNGSLFMEETMKRIAGLKGSDAVVPGHLDIPYRIYCLKAKLAGNAEALEQLERAKKHIVAGNFDLAGGMIDKLVSENKIKSPNISTSQTK